uniref:Putative rna-binding protein involved in translational regulation n=2 Tax=Ornithodoros turicata TaxID=34597 RepID=A0A2R5LNZ2_9ACAR
MKSSLLFRDQVAAMVQWFELWNPCEQTVGLYSLLRRLGPTQARFLALVLERSLAHCTELHQRERHANDPAYIEGLSQEPREHALGQLLGLLPLLSPGNQAAKQAYLALIPQVLAHALERPQPLVEAARQLLSYSLIHPAISSREDRRLLTLWLRHLEERIASTARFPEQVGGGVETELSNGHCSVGSSWPCMSSGGEYQSGGLPGVCPPGGLSGGLPGGCRSYCPAELGSLGGSLPPGLDSSHMIHHPLNNVLSSEAPSAPTGSAQLRRSNSLTPPCSSSMLLHGAPFQWQRAPQSNSQQQNGMGVSPPSEWRLPQGEPGAPPLSPQSSIGSSGSDGQTTEEQQTTFNTDGMRDVPGWLKSLRLHKYAHLFSHMTYDEMMELTEEKLETQNVTKGARHKIVVSIRKLNERPATLQALEKGLEEGGDIRAALQELKAMLQTPMKSCTENQRSDQGYSSSPGSKEDDSPESPPSSLESCPPVTPAGGEQLGDLPALFTRVVGKVCTNILVSSRTDDEDLNLFLMLVDKCLSHDSFSPTQKRRLFSWKQQVQKVWHPLPARRSLDARRQGRWNGALPANEALVGSALGGLFPKGAVRVPGPSSLRLPPLRGAAPHLSFFPDGGPLAMVMKRPSLQEHLNKPHVAVQRTHSAPVRPAVPVYKPSSGVRAPADNSANDPELNNRLESLCRSVTEHALGGSDGMLPF